MRPPQIIRESQSLTPRLGKGARVKPKPSPKVSESSLISKTKEKTREKTKERTNDSISNSSEYEDVVSESINLNRVHKVRAT